MPRHACLPEPNNNVGSDVAAVSRCATDSLLRGSARLCMAKVSVSGKLKEAARIPIYGHSPGHGTERSRTGGDTAYGERSDLTRAITTWEENQ